MLRNVEKLELSGQHVIKPGLERIRAVLKELGSPQEKSDCVAVTGTNGKGSVAAALAAILEANGYSTGLFTSPHLREVTERIKVNGNEIPKEVLDVSLGRVFAACSRLGVHLSYFELLTAACFTHFDREKIDAGVLEIGMGGRWDATNACDSVGSVITNVSLDHTEHLGNTVSEIAREKAGVIRRGGLVVTACEGEALGVIEAESAKKSAECRRMGRDFFCETGPDTSFDYYGDRWTLSGLETQLAGASQAKNAATAVAAAEFLDNRGTFRITPESIRKTLLEVGLEGRMEYLSEDVPVILDCAHNPAAAESLVESLERRHPGKKFNFLITMLENKDAGGFTEALSRVSKRLLVTELPGNERGARAEKILELSRGRFDSVETVKNPLEAYEKLLAYGEPACVCGSFYLAGLIKEIADNEETGDSE